MSDSEGERDHRLTMAIERGVTLALCRVGEAFAEATADDRLGPRPEFSKPRSNLGRALEALEKAVREEAYRECMWHALDEVCEGLKNLGYELDPDSLKAGVEECTLGFVMHIGDIFPVTVTCDDYEVFPTVDAFRVQVRAEAARRRAEVEAEQ
jgi:hypothetical protein